MADLAILEGCLKEHSDCYAILFSCRLWTRHGQDRKPTVIGSRMRGVEA